MLDPLRREQCERHVDERHAARVTARNSACSNREQKANKRVQAEPAAASQKANRSGRPGWTRCAMVLGEGTRTTRWYKKKSAQVFTRALLHGAGGDRTPGRSIDQAAAIMLMLLALGHI